MSDTLVQPRTAAEIQRWPVTFTKKEWPAGALEQMDPFVLTHIVFPLREKSCVQMWPSKLLGAHVRPDGNSQHSTKGGTRQSTATDMHCKNFENLLKLFHMAEAMTAVGGIGIYLDTNTPMIHLDSRSQRVVWVRTKSGEYVYRHKDIVRFYQELAKGAEAWQ